MSTHAGCLSGWRFFSYWFVCVVLISLTGCAKKKPVAVADHRLAEKALASFVLEEGFQIEQIATEPLVADPVAMEVDEYGRIYVVEMHGYPLDKSGTGKIKLLTDTNHDGRPDKSTVFAKGLTLPTGIIRWKKGVLVTDPPHVLYLEDTDGDGRSDVRQIVLTGFALSNPQHNLNNPQYGLDNWIYLAHESSITPTVYKEEFGDRGDDVFFPQYPEGPRLPNNAEGRTVRFRPDTEELEMLSGETQFGQTFDVWGHQFLVSNARHGFQEVIAARYLQRNAYLRVPDATQSLPDHGDAAEVFAITSNPEHQLLTDVGVITSACGITAYTGGNFPKAWDNVLLVAEPVHNLVHADRLKPKGTSFTTSRVAEGREFLASTDSWFRPVNFYVGPDGALYVVDYYRQIIEHPEWMSEEMIQSGELYNGTNQGRIYRITPKGTPPMDWCERLKLGDASDAELVKALENPNLWWRRTAQRLLVERDSKAAVPLLEQLVKKSPAAMGRLHALWTLEGMGELNPGLIRLALRDSVAGIRENAVKLAEIHLSMAEELLKMTHDPDPKVRFQLLCTLGYLETPSAEAFRLQLLYNDLEDEWVQVAALSASSLRDLRMFQWAITRLSGQHTSGRQAFFRRIGSLVGTRQRIESIRNVLRAVTSQKNPQSEWWRAAALGGLADGLEGKELPLDSLEDENEQLADLFFRGAGPKLRQSSLAWLRATGFPQSISGKKVLKKALTIALNRNEEAPLRTDAIGLLTLNVPSGNTPPQVSVLRKIIQPQEPASVQKAAIRALANANDKGLGNFLLKKWSDLTPDIRDEAINALMASSIRVALLLKAIQRGTIQPSTVGWRRSVELMTNPDSSLRKQARNLLEEKPGTRETVLTNYQPALQQAGNPVRGKATFLRVCASCHQIAGKDGVAFGPDLASVRNRTAASLMAEILVPNRSIADGYEFWTIERKGGGKEAGIIAKETPTTLTIRQLGGHETTMLRSDIQSLNVSPNSAMPAGLESQITQQQMADLLAYLKGVKPNDTQAKDEVVMTSQPLVH